MNHDPLCPAKNDPDPKCHSCHLIDKVRQDERERAGIEQTVPSPDYPFTTAVTVRQP